MSLSPLHRRLIWVVAAVLLLGGGVLAARLWLGGYVVRTVLEMGGATEINFKAVHGTPWHLEIDDLAVRIQAQSVSARRLVLDRPHWWTASLGAVRVEGAEWLVFLDGSDLDPWNWPAYGDAPANGEAVQLPLTTLDLDGRIVVRMSAM